MQIASMHFKERAHAKHRRRAAPAQPAEDQGQVRRQAARGDDRARRFRGARARPRRRSASARSTTSTSWLEIFERNADGARRDRAAGRRRQPTINAHVLDIAARHGVRKIIKSKSMVSEESELDRAIEAAGSQVVETDLGEYILQINDYEPPSHIIGPALHKSKEEVADLFAQAHGDAAQDRDRASCASRRAECCGTHYLTADMGISGGNFFVAETGSVVLVTNEGNATLTTTLPKVHVAISGIEKIVPTLGGRGDADAPAAALGDRAVDLELRRHPDRDEGRRASSTAPSTCTSSSSMPGAPAVLGSDVREALRCIRCGACMNHCPVYQNVGGHSYGWVYPGPIGSILTPTYIGLENALDLPQASTMCNQCGVVCPVKIPLPDLLRKLREQQFDARLATVVRARRPARAGRGSRRSPGSTRWRRASARGCSSWMGGRETA